MSEPHPRTPGSRWSQIFESTTSPSAFWPRALEAVREILPAANAALYLQDNTSPGAVRWRLLGLSPQTQALGLNEAEAGSLCQTALAEGQTQLRESFSAVALDTMLGQPPVVILLRATEELCPTEGWHSRLALLAPLTRLLQLHLRCAQSEQSVQQIAAVLDLMLLLNRETRFLAAAMRTGTTPTLCRPGRTPPRRPPPERSLVGRPPLAQSARITRDLARPPPHGLETGRLRRRPPAARPALYPKDLSS